MKCGIGVAICLASTIAMHSARADDCETTADVIAERVGGNVEPRSADIVRIAHPDVAALLLYCGDRRLPKVISVTAYDARPTASFFDVVSAAGSALTNASPAIVRIGAVDCHGRALRSRDELAQLHFGPLRYECQAFVRDGGGTGIAVYRRRRD